MADSKARLRVPYHDPEDVNNYIIHFPLYIKQEFLGPYGLGTSFRKIDITDLEISNEKLQVTYKVTGKPIELFIKLKKKVRGRDGELKEYLSLGKFGWLSTATHRRIVNTLKYRV